MGYLQRKCNTIKLRKYLINYKFDGDYFQVKCNIRFFKVNATEIILQVAFTLKIFEKIFI